MKSTTLDANWVRQSILSFADLGSSCLTIESIAMNQVNQCCVQMRIQQGSVLLEQLTRSSGMLWHPSWDLIQHCVCQSEYAAGKACIFPMMMM